MGAALTQVGPYFPEGIEASKCLGWELVLTGAPRRVGVGTPGILRGCEESSARGGRILHCRAKFSTTRSALAREGAQPP